MTTLIRNVLALQGDALETLDILINHQKIEVIAPAGSIPTDGHDEVISGENKLLLPGFVNGHTHSYQVWQRGLIPQLPLELWLADLIDSSPQQLDQYYCEIGVDARQPTGSSGASPNHRGIRLT